MYEPSNDDEQSALANFFESRVLDTLSSDERTFLDAGALLPWTMPALLAAIIELPEADCACILQNIVRRFIFLMPYDAGDGDADRVTYQLHPLVRDFLREAAALSPEVRDDIRRRATAWLLEHDNIDTALTLLGTTQVASVTDLLARIPIPLITEIESLLDDPLSLSAGDLSAFCGWAITDPQNPDAYVHSIQRAADIFEHIGFHHCAIEMIISLAFIKRRTSAAVEVHGGAEVVARFRIRGLQVRLLCPRRAVADKYLSSCP